MRMKRLSIDRIRELFTGPIFAMYLLKRTSLIRERGRWRKETNAEHSWSVGVLACSLAPRIDPELDIGLVAQFASVHDLVEIFAGDTEPYGHPHHLAGKNEREARALERLAQEYGDFEWLVDTIRRYEAKDTPEALYVCAVDKLTPLMARIEEKGHYYKTHGVSKAFFEERNEPQRRKAHSHEGVAEYYEALRREFDAHPEYFASASR